MLQKPIIESDDHIEEAFDAYYTHCREKGLQPMEQQVIETTVGKKHVYLRFRGLLLAKYNHLTKKL